jgi:hypothetical protein
VQQTVLDWLRRERSDRARLWCVIGPFANWEGAGHETSYPPEHQVDLGAVHAGWRDPVRWERWYAIGQAQNELDLDDALALPLTGPATVLPETFYAYAECNASSRQPAVLRLRTQTKLKVFVNGALCHETAQTGEPAPGPVSISTVLKQGKNSFLLKMSRTRVAAQIAFELASDSRDPLSIKWWR